MKCVLISPRARAWIQNGRSPRILHLFDQVINLADENGNVVSIASSTLGPGPFSMIIGGDFSELRQGIDLQDDVTMNNAACTITLGSNQIETETAVIWNPIPNWSQLQRQIFVSNELAGELALEIAAPFQRLLAAVYNEDTYTARQETRALAGLGGGLTPTGDDVLTGLLYALWVWRPGSKWLDLIPEWAAPLTTTLSAAYLRAAGCGEATIHWHNLAAGNPGALEQILAIGHTSGKDAWAGFSLAFRTLSWNHVGLKRHSFCSQAAV